MTEAKEITSWCRQKSFRKLTTYHNREVSGHRDGVTMKKAICFFAGLWQPATPATPDWCRFSVFLLGSDDSKGPSTLCRCCMRDLYTHLWKTRNSLVPPNFLPVYIQQCARGVEGGMQDCFEVLCVLFHLVSIFKNVFLWFLHFLFFDISGVKNRFFSLTTVWIVKDLCRPVDDKRHHGITEGFCFKMIFTGDIAQGISRTYIFSRYFTQKFIKKFRDHIFEKASVIP